MIEEAEEKKTTITLQISSSAVSHPGAVHDVNEDAFLDKPEIGLWAVADGVGGHSLAKTASRVVVDSLKSLSFACIRQKNSCDKITEKLVEANLYLYQLAKNQLTGKSIASTAVVLYIYAGQYHIFWVGDSRCYVFRDGKLQMLTQDHSQFERQVETGVTFDEYATQNKLSNILTRAVGVKNELNIDTVSGEIKSDDVFWLCSDGGLKCLMEKEVEELMTTHTRIDHINDCIVHTSLQRKVGDNITSILVSAKLQ
ncbi:MAG: PP2C family serine/threonine-protein phosphatase [Bdellovibrionota bacterium]